MAAVLEAGFNLNIEEWNQLRTRAIFDHCKWDPQSGDNSVLARYPLLLSAEGFQELHGLAESLSREALAAEQEILCRPRLWRKLSIPQKIRRALLAEKTECEPNHVRVMRFDFHYTRVGWQISEVNADVPGGYIEGSGWNALFGKHCEEGSAPASPSRTLAQAAQSHSCTRQRTATTDR